jgi:Cold shock proteins
MNRYDDNRDARRRGGGRRDSFDSRDGGFGGRDGGFGGRDGGFGGRDGGFGGRDGGFGGREGGFGGRPSRDAFAAPAGPPTDATVKWFNPEKGFGFVACEDGSGDAFLSMRSLEAAGFSGAEPGARIVVRLREGPKGNQVAEVLELEDLPPQPRAPRGPRAGGGGGFAPRVPEGPAEEMAGTVKWYNRDKGFGFVQPDDGGRDVFVHASTLQRGGIADLAEGQRVNMSVVAGAKGREASMISYAD